MTQVYAFEPPERFVAGTVGVPGERTFFLQARGGGRIVSVVLEKVQMSLLAEKLEELLAEAKAISVTSLTYLLTWNSAPTSSPAHEMRNSRALPSVR